MKNFYASVLLIFSCITLTVAQNNNITESNPFPTLSTLTSWAAYNSQPKFDLEIRNLGFKFEEKIAAGATTSFTYIRKTKVNEINYTDRIVYKIANDNSASIISLVTASTDLVRFYTPQLTNYKIGKCETEMAKDSKTTCSCYESANFSIDLCDERVKLSMGDGNKYFLSVTKK
ncbi:hypothetical protein HNQ02_002454 [Flavobacterium sp. 7E]|uniref:hypothetical protein n=1 Tax=unclassified Flavobacterium TaxID=196869 RepID=UPI00156D6E07|nr:MULTISPECIES: hypothetical protein [unclassified Flavobacterium]MBE0391404.1 hypothetical protein [Flavobacterium sp. PL002]NRS89523.1 hypothetical protein [Flavobacterium sp. 7E]